MVYVPPSAYYREPVQTATASAEAAYKEYLGERGITSSEESYLKSQGLTDRQIQILAERGISDFSGDMVALKQALRAYERIESGVPVTIAAKEAESTNYGYTYSNYWIDGRYMKPQTVSYLGKLTGVSLPLGSQEIIKITPEGVRTLNVTQQLSGGQQPAGQPSGGSAVSDMNFMDVYEMMKRDYGIEAATRFASGTNEFREAYKQELLGQYFGKEPISEEYRQSIVERLKYEPVGIGKEAKPLFVVERERQIEKGLAQPGSTAAYEREVAQYNVFAQERTQAIGRVKADAEYREFQKVVGQVQAKVEAGGPKVASEVEQTILESQLSPQSKSGMIESVFGAEYLNTAMSSSAPVMSGQDALSAGMAKFSSLGFFTYGGDKTSTLVYKSGDTYKSIGLQKVEVYGPPKPVERSAEDYASSAWSYGLAKVFGGAPDFYKGFLSERGKLHEGFVGAEKGVLDFFGGVSKAYPMTKYLPGVFNPELAGPVAAGGIGLAAFVGDISYSVGKPAWDVISRAPVALAAVPYSAAAVFDVGQLLDYGFKHGGSVRGFDERFLVSQYVPKPVVSEYDRGVIVSAGSEFAFNAGVFAAFGLASKAPMALSSAVAGVPAVGRVLAAPVMKASEFFVKGFVPGAVSVASGYGVYSDTGDIGAAIVAGGLTWGVLTAKNPVERYYTEPKYEMVGSRLRLPYQELDFNQLADVSRSGGRIYESFYPASSELYYSSSRAVTKVPGQYGFAVGGERFALGSTTVDVYAQGIFSKTMMGGEAAFGETGYGRFVLKYNLFGLVPSTESSSMFQYSSVFRDAPSMLYGLVKEAPAGVSYYSVKTSTISFKPMGDFVDSSSILALKSKPSSSPGVFFAQREGTLGGYLRSADLYGFSVSGPSYARYMSLASGESLITGAGGFKGGTMSVGDVRFMKVPFALDEAQYSSFFKTARSYPFGKYSGEGFIMPSGGDISVRSVQIERVPSYAQLPLSFYRETFGTGFSGLVGTEAKVANPFTQKGFVAPFGVGARAPRAMQVPFPLEKVVSGTEVLLPNVISLPSQYAGTKVSPFVGSGNLFASLVRVGLSDRTRVSEKLEDAFKIASRNVFRVESRQVPEARVSEVIGVMERMAMQQSIRQVDLQQLKTVQQTQLVELTMTTPVLVPEVPITPVFDVPQVPPSQVPVFNWPSGAGWFFGGLLGGIGARGKAASGPARYQRSLIGILLGFKPRKQSTYSGFEVR